MKIEIQAKALKSDDNLTGFSEENKYEDRKVVGRNSDASDEGNQVNFPLETEPSGFYDPNTTQTNALLSIRDNHMNLILQQVYYSDKCSWFYIGLLILSFGLILVTVFDGFQVAESPMFIVLEFLLNLLIGVDFACRVKLVGCKKYVRD